MKKIFAAVIVLYLFSACNPFYRARPELSDKAQIGENDVVVVGKVLYDPPITKDTQSLMMGMEGLKYRIILLCGSELREMSGNSMISGSRDLKDIILAYQDETFYVRNDRKPFYIIASAFYKSIYIRSTGKTNTTYYNSVMSPASFRINIRPDDKAVYIGTIKYHRDNFFNPHRIEIVDEYDREMPEFRRVFGDTPLRKALIREPAPGFEYKVGEPY